MDAMLEKLKEYGADVDGAMERFLGDETLYKTCFMIFLDDAAFQQLGDALLAMDYKKAFESAHTLKGVAGNMGLTPIYKLICNIADALRKNEYSALQDCYAEIIDQHDKLKDLSAVFNIS
ncbi:MAG: Hpt domain-containing protein [Clostridia bacterium]